MCIVLEEDGSEVMESGSTSSSTDNVRIVLLYCSNTSLHHRLVDGQFWYSRPNCYMYLNVDSYCLSHVSHQEPVRKKQYVAIQGELRST